jgi:class 3 adenylate cyclase
VSASTGERRVVSVLLVDIAGSTMIGERLGPERSKFLFDEVARLIVGEVKRYGGTVAQLTGDGLYALLLPDEAPPEERYNALGDTVNLAAGL